MSFDDRAKVRAKTFQFSNPRLGRCSMSSNVGKESGRGAPSATDETDEGLHFIK
jgi:hypothetical protein